MTAQLVPATATVIEWAARESGYTLRALANLTNVTEAEIESWIEGQHPELAKLQKFASVVQRPFAAFLLPAPPSIAEPSIEFRSLDSSRNRDLLPEERRRIREASRLQQILVWLSKEMRLPPPNLPWSSTRNTAEDVAREIRVRLNVTVDTQLSWNSAASALAGWREAVEDLGVTVLMLPMGEESCRGFSLWDDCAPLIAVNSSWSPEARVFTLFHEVAHLVSRTNSACAEDDAPRSNAKGDRVERWCERVAAAVVVPADDLAAFLVELWVGSATRNVDLSTVGKVASHFRVSRRAAALRLIECRKAAWPLYNSIPAHSDTRPSGGGGTGRNRAEIRRQEYGQPTMEIFRDAVREEILGPADVVDYLRLSVDELDPALPVAKKAQQ